MRSVTSELIKMIFVGILKLHRDALLQMEFIHAAQFLTKLPSGATDGEQLFRCINELSMFSRGNRRWRDVLSLLLQQSSEVGGGGNAASGII